MCGIMSKRALLCVHTGLMTEQFFPPFLHNRIAQTATYRPDLPFRIAWDLHQLEKPSVLPAWLGDLDKLKPALVRVSIIIF